MIHAASFGQVRDRQIFGLRPLIHRAWHQTESAGQEPGSEGKHMHIQVWPFTAEGIEKGGVVKSAPGF
jgi:hypothetical protein